MLQPLFLLLKAVWCRGYGRTAGVSTDMPCARDIGELNVVPTFSSLLEAEA
jgi:hypothetical protein